jgi:hypothetical protein
MNPLPLSKSARVGGWRSSEKWFSGSGFAAAGDARRCSGFVSIAIADNAIAARPAAAKPGAGSTGRPTAGAPFRSYLYEVCAAAGLPARIVPHQLRHTYASEMPRCGVDLPALMKMLGHASPEMTMVYLDIALTDLQREFELARSHSLHVTSPPRTPPSSARQGFGGLIESLLTAQHVVEMYRRTLSDRTARRSLERLVNRLAKILAEVRKLETP